MLLKTFLPEFFSLLLNHPHNWCLLSLAFPMKSFALLVGTLALPGRGAVCNMGVNPGGIYPPLVLGRGDGQCYHPPWKWMKLCHILSEIPYRSAWKSLITTIFYGLSLIFIIQLVEFIVNHWNKHNCFQNCSHIQVIYNVLDLLTCNINS